MDGTDNKTNEKKNLNPAGRVPKGKSGVGHQRETKIRGKW